MLFIIVLENVYISVFEILLKHYNEKARKTRS